MSEPNIRLNVVSTTPAPTGTMLGDLKVGQIGVLSKPEGIMPVGHYLRTYELLILLEDPMSTYDAASFDFENGTDFEVNILNVGSTVTLKVI